MQTPPPETPPRAIERADFLASGPAHRPPPDTAPWQPVALPDNWHATRPGASGGGWYRIVLPITSVPRRVHAVYLPRDSASTLLFYLNGSITGINRRPEANIGQNQQPFLTAMPAGLFREGTNVLHVYVEARSDLREGLTRVWFGDSLQVRALWMENYKRHVFLAVAFALVVLIAGAAALLLWARTRRDPAFLWFGLSGVLLGVPALASFFFESGPIGHWREAWQTVQTFGYAPALALGAFGMAGVASRPLATALWALLAAGCAAPWLLGTAARAQAFVALGLLFLGILAASFLVMIARARGQPAWMRATGAVALLVAMALAAHDVAHWLGWIDFDRVPLSPFAASALACALGVLLVSRHLDAVRGLEESKAMLEQRVTERTAEIERAHEHLRELEAEQATVSERQRIMADMHDGLGASLVSLLGTLQAGKADRRELEQRAHGALLDLRLAVDSLDTPPGDLNMALGTVRYRMRDAFDVAGATLDWDVDDLPHPAHFGPTRILHVQRILLEALTNALRHSGAARFSVSAHMRGEVLELLVADDGRGFAGGSAGGRGLMIMQRRASTLGGSLEIASAPGSGTRIVLRIPLADGRARLRAEAAAAAPR